MDIPEKTYIVINGTSYDDRTPVALTGVLDRLRSSQERVRIQYGDQETGRMFEEGLPFVGRIGRSTGTSKIPLLVHNKRSMGGEALLDYCILQITASKGGALIWRHPNYKPEEKI